MSHSIVTTQLASAVADTGTFTVAYPSGKDEGSFYLAMGHVLSINGNRYVFPEDFDLTFGTSDITVTNRTGASWPVNATVRIQLEEPGQRGYVSDRTDGTVLKSATEYKGIMVSMCPDTADADGYFASQDLTSAGVASVSTTVAAAIAAAALAGTADTPRNVVAAWTGAAVLTVTGTDAYGETIVESSASGTSFTGKKAFKTVTGISVSANVTSLTVGTGIVIGLPVFLPSEGHVEAVVQDGVRLPPRIYLPWEIEQTELLAPTSEYIVTPYAGIIDRNTTVVQGAVTTGGAITVELSDVAVVGLTNTIANSAVAGSVVTDQPTDVTGNATTTRVAARGAIEIAPGSAFDTAGSVNGVLEINTQGVFQAGIRTANGSTATTGDVRGTFCPPVNPDGAIVFNVFLSLPDAGFVGIDQYDG